VSWETLVKEPGAWKAVCLELELDGATYYFADTELREGDKYWQPRILNTSEIIRAIDPTNKRFDISDVTITLDNSNNDSDDAGYFEELLNSETLDNRAAKLYVKFEAADGTIYSKQVYSGICLPEGFSPDGTKFTLRLRSDFRAKLGLLRCPINGIAFPYIPNGTVADHPESTLGWGVSVVGGAVTSNKRGGVRLIMVDDTANAEVFLIAGHGIINTPYVYRKRANVFTLLTLTTHYTLERCAIDGEGNTYSYIKLTSGQWAEGDEYYADVTGIPQEGYVTPDGTNDYCSRAFANLSSDFPGVVSKAFAVEFKVRITTAGTAVTIGGVWGVAANQRSWQAYRVITTNKLCFYTSANGTEISIAKCDTTLLDGIATDYTIRICYNPDGIAATDRVKIWINGIAQAGAAWAATTSLYTGGVAPFELLTHDSGANLMPGRLYYCIIADGAQALASGTSGDRSASALENIISEWQFYSPYESGATHYVQDVVGDNDLTCVSLDDTDFTQVSCETNPAWLADKIFRYKWFGWNVTYLRSHLATIAATCNTRAYNTAGYFGYLTPESEPKSGIEKPIDQWGLLADFCRQFHHNPIISLDGYLRLKEIDITANSEDTLPFYCEKDGDTASGFKKTLRNWPLANEVFIRYVHSHHDYEAAARAYNTESQTQFNLTESVEWKYRGIRHSAMMEDVVIRDLEFSSGQRSVLEFNPRLLTGLQANCDVGDYIDVWPIKRPHDDKRQYIVYVNAFNPVTGTSRLELIPAQSHVGTCLYEEGEKSSGGGSEPEGATVLMSANTFVGKSDGGVHIDAHNATSYGSLQYLRHGHCYGNTTACYCVSSSPPISIGTFANEAAARAYADATYWGVPMWKHIAKGYGNGDWRSLYRASFAAHAGKTVASAQMRLFVIEKPSLEWKFNISQKLEVFTYWIATQGYFLDGYYALPSDYQCRSGWSGGAVHRCTDTNWTTASTWYGEGWTDAKISTQLATFGNSTGLLYVTLNAAGLAYLQNACDGSADGGSGDEVNLVLEAHSTGDYSENIKIASSRHATANYRPALIVEFSA